MKTKFKKLILIIITIALQTSCDQSGVNNYTPEIIQPYRSLQMGEFLKATIREDENSTDVFADLELTYKPEDQEGLIEFTGSSIFINGVVSGGFYENKCTVPIKEFGSLEFKIEFLNEIDGKMKVVHAVSENLDVHISKFYLDTREDYWYAKNEMIENENVELYNLSHANGGHAVCWMYNLRIPEGKSLTFTPEIVGHNDITPWQNKILTVHFRYKDYKDRNDLYVAPDEAMFHIDKEVDKWIADGEQLTLTEGIYVLYVVPSRLHDLSELTIYTTGDFNSTVSGFFKSLDYESLGYPAP